MDEPWQVFFEEFRRSTDDVPERVAARGVELEDAAHDAYRETTDLLASEHGYEEDEALALAKVFAREVKKWLEEGDPEMEELRERLEVSQQEWELAEDVPA